MNSAQICSTIEKTKKLLKYGGSVEEHETNIERLGELVTLTCQCEAIRNKLSQHPSILQLSADALYHAFHTDQASNKFLEVYIRNLRGLLLLVRNLSVSTCAIIDLHKILLGMQNFRNSVKMSHSKFPICLESYLQLMANVCTSQKPLNEDVVELLTKIFDESMITFISSTIGVKLTVPFNILVNTLLQDEVVFLTNSRILFSINSYIFQKGLTHVNETALDFDLLPLLQKTVTNPVFRDWIIEKSSSSNFPEILTLCQLIVTSIKEWITPNTHTIAGWISDIFCQLSAKSIQILLADSINLMDLEFTHQCLVRTLDMMTEICKFQGMPEFFECQNTIDILIQLFKVVQDNTRTQTPKSSIPSMSKQVSKGAKKRFPLVKSLIIEIITTMSSNSRSVQDAVRRYHGLELVLSSCVIDDDNPFVKEQAILCLKFLLDKNEENQNFVAQLEAREVINYNELSQVGCEVSLKNGKITLKQER